MASKKLIILGEEVKEEDFPGFYKMAMKNPENAAAQIKKIVENERKAGNTNFSVSSAIIILNSDLN